MVMVRTPPAMAVITLPLEGQGLAVHEALVEMGIDYTVAYRGEQTDDNGWKHDEWLFQFARHEGAIRKLVATMRQEYRTGTGHRRPKPGAPKFDGSVNTLYREDWEKAYMRVVVPPAAGLLYSMLSDADYAIYTFNAWCDELGFDNDSIKASQIYRACQEVHDELGRFFARGQVDTLRALLEDY